MGFYMDSHRVFVVFGAYVDVYVDVWCCSPVCVSAQIHDTKIRHLHDKPSNICGLCLKIWFRQGCVRVCKWLTDKEFIIYNLQFIIYHKWIIKLPFLSSFE